jgi:hypothetical protein
MMLRCASFGYWLRELITAKTALLLTPSTINIDKMKAQNKYSIPGLI